MSALFVNRLTVVDSSLLDPKLGLLGESWIADILLEGSLDEQGMVLDFALVKRKVKALIDSEFDHRLLVPARHPGSKITLDGDRCSLDFTLASGERIRHDSPRDAVALVDAGRVTEASLAEAIIGKLRALLPKNVKRIELSLRPEETAGAWYRYSHGLRHHEGNCQRIAHGHRSRIVIHRDGERDGALEAEWARRWRDVYIGTRGDLVDERVRDGVRYLAFGYAASQGGFRLELPARRCYLVETDSTVENLAEHIAARLAEAHPGARFRVQAFEGVDKGAIGLSG